MAARITQVVTETVIKPQPGLRVTQLAVETVFEQVAAPAAAATRTQIVVA